MDNYPNELAPEFDECGAVKTPFHEWWPNVKHAFQNVPETVAENWLHRHWGQSPFSWIPSQSYAFSMEEFPSNNLPDVLNRMHDYEEGSQKALDQGKFICGDHPVRPWRHEPLWLVQYMRDHHSFPSPIIVLDNSDNHLATTAEISEVANGCPIGLILIEGHRRHQIGLYLHSISQLQDQVSICRLKPV